MATIKYLLQSDKENSNIYLRYSVGRASVWKRKTGFVINSKNWSIDKAQPLQKTDELKALKFKLDKLAIFINEAYNKAISIGVEVDGDWLQYEIDLFNNKICCLITDLLLKSVKNAYAILEACPTTNNIPICNLIVLTNVSAKPLVFSILSKSPLTAAIIILLYISLNVVIACSKTPPDTFNLL
jgi:hypothetical protein